MNVPTDPEKPKFPMRINKFLALERNCSRREGDEIIRAGRVYINGRLAVLGDKVMETDRVEVRFRIGNTNLHERRTRTNTNG